MVHIDDSKRMENLYITSMKKKIVEVITNSIKISMKDGTIVHQMKKLYH